MSGGAVDDVYHWDGMSLVQKEVVEVPLSAIALIRSKTWGPGSKEVNTATPVNVEGTGWVSNGTSCQQPRLSSLTTSLTAMPILLPIADLEADAQADVLSSVAPGETPTHLTIDGSARIALIKESANPPSSVTALVLAVADGTQLAKGKVVLVAAWADSIRRNVVPRTVAQLLMTGSACSQFLQDNESRPARETNRGGGYRKRPSWLVSRGREFLDVCQTYKDTMMTLVLSGCVFGDEDFSSAKDSRGNLCTNFTSWTGMLAKGKLPEQSALYPFVVVACDRPSWTRELRCCCDVMKEL